MSMKKFLVIAALAVALAMGGNASAQTTTTTSTTTTSTTTTSLAASNPALVYTITGSFSGLPGWSDPVYFSCTTTGSTAATQSCDFKVGIVNATFTVASTTGTLTFTPAVVCGTTKQGGSCALAVSADDSNSTTVSLTLNSCSYTGSHAPFRAYLPCGRQCFGGIVPNVIVSYSVASSPAC